ncbi:hypothetical protein BU25DRAFT_221595 [Macroventuria anomochaeta]|uniref:Uncharacterized protein n=1 Tax=Macroventuria anomochaeta TaxID=301207 RepID=A0ACB6SA16_9PLEO|nr:uncharacterized protein BU25DRAFT_221595 [Macroventuria anomochaeta]KAF2630971.1 hypothetical protein BU25DRAFT_221595 [Macroventuria anomochaeta]
MTERSQRDINQRRASTVCRTGGRGSVRESLSTWLARDISRDKQRSRRPVHEGSVRVSKCYLLACDWSQCCLICSRSYTEESRGSGCRWLQVKLNMRLAPGRLSDVWQSSSRQTDGPHCGDVNGGPAIDRPVSTSCHRSTTKHHHSRILLTNVLKGSQIEFRA